MLHAIAVDAEDAALSLLGLFNAGIVVASVFLSCNIWALWAGRSWEILLP